MKSRSKHIIMMTVLSVLTVFLIGFTSKRQNDRRVNDLMIDIQEQEGNFFISQFEVTSLINAENTDYVLGLNVDQLDLKELERRVEANAFVKDAQVYKDIRGNLQVDLVQSKPVARILSHRGDSRYIDESGELLPLNTQHTARVPIIELDKEQDWEQSISEDEFGTQLLQLLRFVDRDEFWRAQIAHIVIDEKNELTFIPQVTKQEVIFGTPTDIEDKFSRLKLFYKEVLPAKGWNTYAYVNVKFNNQIVCK